MSSRSRIPELQSIEFKGSESVADYSRAGRDLARDLGYELHESAAELQAALAAQKGHPLLLGLDVKLRARRVAAHLKRAAEGQVGVAAALVKMNAEYKRQFVDPAQANRSKQRKKKWTL
ncbi:hypothetical protein [Actinomadura sp. DC4]|uniref:hypothetical protein n=1 Tax=Actinomadura sp. DC4 TaxID=3055069 RepID=UPI0025B18255|nr:hypothetical protein [Actinomadura sp. DC4]MDN3356108.1 hypothetical protein [Actinomadura sp. DC4]